MDRRVRKTKKLIIDSFFELLKTLPVNKITVKKLCDKADINRSTFYDHYSDITSFVAMLEEDVLEKSLGCLALYNYDKNTDRSLENLFNIMIENRNLFSIMFMSPDFSCWNRYKEIIIIQTIQKWQEDSDLTNSEIRLILEYALNGMYGILKYWMFTDYQETESVKEIFANVGKYGVYHYAYKEKNNNKK